ncbi:hypothetical protein SELMODRAFT_440920 [Selaginella moellendorffii]|uniref:DNA mismatch repair proteins mutS family domain-containing protein n=1 Tax=Selaginella moellendorffii TaxID=88036 RepID=D8RFE8_SELML|nr:hypothetical protein SELMODRAFT_440920 [Selaginella moellendorffii]
MSPGIVRKIVENMESGIACYGLLKHEFAGARLFVGRIVPSSCSCCSSRCFIVKPHPRYLSRTSLRDINLQFLRSRFSTWASSSPDQALREEEEIGSSEIDTSTSKVPKDLGESVRFQTDNGMELKVSSSVLERTGLEQSEASSQESEVLLRSKEEILVSSTSDSSITSEIPAPKMTIIVFDLETTGFRAAGDRIIEFAARDLAGGDRSTISALVNPGRTVPYLITAVTGITNQMVNKPHVPSWKEVGPSIIQFVESRRKGDEPVILVAHNGKRFDVPFLLKEFQSCGIQVPEWWLFLDSMPLAREAKKKFGYNWRSLKLSVLHEAYGLHSTERAHRAMADVNMLASVLEAIVSELQLPASVFLEKAFTADEVYASSKLFQDMDRGELVTDSSATQELTKEDRLNVPWEDLELEITVDEVEEEMVLEEDVEVVRVEMEQQSSRTFLDTGSVDSTVLSPALANYVEAKRKRPSFIHLLKAGDFYEALFEDAISLSRTCKIRQSTVEDGEIEVPVTRFPACKFYVYTKILLDRGTSVVKVGDEVQESICVLTPGMLLDEGIIDETHNNYLVAVNVSADSSWGLAFCDLATGDFCATQSEGLAALMDELGRLKPREAIFNSQAIRTYLEEVCVVARDSSEFSPISNDTLLLPYIGEKTVDAIQQWSLTDTAARALLRYVQQIQAFALDELSLRQLLLYKTEDYLRLDEGVRSYLELVEGKRTETASLLWAMDETKSSMGTRLLRQWMLHPLRSLESILLRQNAVEVLLKNSPVREALRSCLSTMVDIANLSGSIARQSTFSWDELIALADSLLMLPRISQMLEEFPGNDYFSAVIRHQAFAEKLAEEIQVARSSATDADIGFEASDTISERSDLVESLRKKVTDSLLTLQETSSALAALDVLCNFAEIAAARDFSKPELVPDGRQITIVDGRHPLVEIRKDFQPTSCSLGYQPRRGRSKKVEDRPDLLIVTGPRGSGKTCYLQQVALIQVLAQIGSFVPAKEARLSIADGIYSVDWPDGRKVLDKVTSSSLVLLDDFRLRTGFQETEAALLRAVMEYLANHSGDYPEWIRRRAGKLLEKNARSSSCGEEAGNEDADQGTNLWHKIMSFTKVKTKNSRDSKTKEPAQAPGEDLEQLWQQVSTVLQSSPATLALATQKGSLVSISKTSQPAIVTIGSSPLFVRKFQQHEHAAALEAAFESLLNRPVKLQILVDD